MTAADSLSVQPVKEPGKPPYVLLGLIIPGMDLRFTLAPHEAVELGTYLLKAASEALQ